MTNNRINGATNDEKPKDDPSAGSGRIPTNDQIWALKLLDANESIAQLRQTTVEYSNVIAEKERMITQLQRAYAELERKTLITAGAEIRKKFNLAPNEVLQQNLVTGEARIVELKSETE